MTQTPVVETTGLLSRIAAELATERDRWEPLVRFDPDRRWYRRLAQKPSWEAWLLSWLPGQSTALHDHGTSSGAFTVLTGVLHETVPSADPWGSVRTGQVALRRQAVAPGSVRSFGAGFIHDVTNDGQAPAVSLHIYGPALTTMTRYVVTDGKLLPTTHERAGIDW